MFDWDDEELTNIIWGDDDDDDDDDHIVPYPPTKKGTDQTLASKTPPTSTANSSRNGDDFVDYGGWANIGSFDDLDRIFGDAASLANADDSSHLSLRTSIDSQYMLHPRNSFISGDATSQNVQGQRSSKMSELRHPHSLSSRWINNSYAQPMVVLSQQIPRQRPKPFHPLNHFPGAPLASPFDGNMMNHYSSGYEVPRTNPNPLKNSENASMRPPEMTPKEKVEKLRRRQQMRAIIAIQKQQLEFKNRASGSGPSSFEERRVEADESLEPNSPVEQYDSNTISKGLDNCSVEESVLYRLQDIIAKMDMRTRRCIRDSLSRLAQSAMLRQYPNDTSSTRDEVHSDKDTDSHERFTRRPDVETDTNPIDRSVAHLLFHRPLEFCGKPIETPESPLSANLPYVKNSKSESPSQFLLTCTNSMDDETAAMDDENANEG